MAYITCNYMICVYHWFSEPGDPPEAVPPQPDELVHPEPSPPQPVKQVSPQPIPPQPVEQVSPQPIPPQPVKQVSPQPIPPQQIEPAPPQPVDPGMYMHIPYVYSHTIIDSPPQAVPLDHL